ncbi:MAG TPA: four helix bundle protein [Candidatus Paceibacterota bacterium]
MPIIQKLISAYKLWREYFIHFDKIFRYGLGLELDSLFINTIKNVFIASYKSRDKKLIHLTKASEELDLLKLLLRVAWEIKALDNKKYIALSEKLNEVGKMLGGWIKTTPPISGRG